MILALTPEELAGVAGWRRIAGALRQLPLRRAGFEGRTRAVEWAFLGLWPIGDDLEPVVSQRAADIAFSMLKRQELEPRRKTPRPHPRDEFVRVGRKYEKLAREFGPEADWGGLLFGLRCEVKRTRLALHRVTKLEIVEQLADVYFELTGEKPNLGYTNSSPPTRFEWLGDAVFDGEPWRSSGKRACQRFSKKVGNSSPR
jgi:hypothetical protein